MNRQITIDMFRALAVLLVTSFHVWRVIGKPAIQMPFGFDLLAPLANGWIGVGIFFVISGYCMGASAEKIFKHGWATGSYCKYLLSRFLRIAPSYYVAILIWYVLINFYQIAVKPTGQFDLVTHFLFVHNLFDETFFTTSGVFWSVAVEVQLYLFLPFLIVFAPSKKIRVGILLLTALMCIGVSFLSEQYRVIRWGVPNYLFLFVVGWLLYCYKDKVGEIFGKKYITPIIFSITTSLLFFNYNIVAGESKLYEALVSVFVGVCMIVLARSEAEFTNYTICSTLSLIGKCSFSIYLYNYIFYAVTPVKPTLPTFLVLTLSVIGFGMLMYYLVEVQAEKFRRFVLDRKAKVLLAPKGI